MSTNKGLLKAPTDPLERSDWATTQIARLLAMQLNDRIKALETEFQIGALDALREVGNVSAFKNKMDAHAKAKHLAGNLTCREESSAKSFGVSSISNMPKVQLSKKGCELIGATSSDPLAGLEWVGFTLATVGPDPPRPRRSLRTRKLQPGPQKLKKRPPHLTYTVKSATTDDVTMTLNNADVVWPALRTEITVQGNPHKWTFFRAVGGPSRGWKDLQVVREVLNLRQNYLAVLIVRATAVTQHEIVQPQQALDLSKYPQIQKTLGHGGNEAKLFEFKSPPPKPKRKRSPPLLQRRTPSTPATKKRKPVPVDTSSSDSSDSASSPSPERKRKPAARKRSPSRSCSPPAKKQKTARPLPETPSQISAPGASDVPPPNPVDQFLGPLQQSFNADPVVLFEINLEQAVTRCPQAVIDLATAAVFRGMPAVSIPQAVTALKAAKAIQSPQ